MRRIKKQKEGFSNKNPDLIDVENLNYSKQKQKCKNGIEGKSLLNTSQKLNLQKVQTPTMFDYNVSYTDEYLESKEPDVQISKPSM